MFVRAASLSTLLYTHRAQPHHRLNVYDMMLAALVSVNMYKTHYATAQLHGASTFRRLMIKTVQSWWCGKGVNTLFPFWS